jgi:SAM-dependent methyltransferase
LRSRLPTPAYPCGQDLCPRAAVSGAAYVREITARESDRRAREAFQQLALRSARPGSLLFDFGSGPGLDARFYAERGFMVAGYDTDPEMNRFFADYCRDLIDSGRVTLQTGPYREFLDREGGFGERSVNLVTANFAPLNLIENATELFARFHRLTEPDGKVLAAVLSPYFTGDMKYSWWWRNGLRLLRSGHYSIPGAQGLILRRSIREFARSARPYFTLERIHRGWPATNLRDTAGVDPDRHGAWLHVTVCRFMFLLFRRNSPVR